MKTIFPARLSYRLFLGAVVLLCNFFAPDCSASWSTKAPMEVARQFHPATLLLNGKVLVAGGEDDTYQTTVTAELFDPITETWTRTGSMTTNRVKHTATLLLDGRVLVVGGGLDSSELYDPVTGVWSTTGQLTIPRIGHSATLLANGKVLVAGGEQDGPQVSCEIYDPATGLWTPTGSMNAPRSLHGATLMTNGWVLVSGGRDGNQPRISTVEIYNPISGIWSNAAPMICARRSHTATTLPATGQVLVVGGQELGAEFYDPVAGSWTLNLLGGVTNALYGQTASQLPNGKVLVASGMDNASTNYNDSVTKQAWIYDPLSESWSQTAPLNTARYVHTATVLTNGKVLVAGGGNLNPPYRETSTELFSLVDPIALTSSTILPNGSFQAGFTNTPAASFSVFKTEDISAPLTNWAPLGTATEISVGEYRFIDTQAANSRRRFYRVQSN